MSHFNNILHYVVDIFKDFRDCRHNLTGPIKLERYTEDGNQYVIISCKINIFYASTCEDLSNKLAKWHIADGKLVYIINVEFARTYNVCKSRKDPQYGIA